MDWLFHLSLGRRSFLLPVDAVAVSFFVYLLVRTKSRLLIRGIAIATGGALVGGVLVWLVSDVWNVFGIALTPVVHVWVVLVFSGVFLAVSNFWASRWWRKTIAAISILSFLVAAGAGINVDFGAYRNLNDALGVSPYSALPAARMSAHAGTMDASLAKTWKLRDHTGMPTHGTVGMVTIPGATSHFVARKAAVYLPPAALVADPPVLPLLILFTGQPGTPTEMFTSGRVPAILDSYAAAHAGLAPIVVVPDQLGAPLKNPMCADSRLGKAATYLTVDVREWILTHLHVATSGRYWGVGGYSEGGTCSIQFGAGRPDLFGSTIDILGEVVPSAGANTLSDAFGGSRSAYRAIKPLPLLARHAPYEDSLAIFGAGVKDHQFGAYARTVEAAAARSGMKTRLIVSPDSGHDWNTVRYVLTLALPEVCARWGLGS
ncbi:alpha/beta hydrolase-fold protein [Frigoribacterium sp. UYMn621]|uniref:alpha/beta hydrolase n=1 Tax=Frigoribacterium sp. UYMn621 TaxID=3156343 RepID=UPI00339536B4